MIPQITEVNFPAYATLSNATASFADMGDRVINTEVKIDGEVVPDFTGWELLFRGERFVLNVKDPQAAKDNTSICSKVSLAFYSWPILQLKRFFAFTVQTTATGQVTADKYNASVSLTLSNFCAWLNEVLDYYFDRKIYVDLADGVNSEEAMVEMNYAYIWDVIQKIYETFGVKWRIVYVQNTDSYVIRVGYSELSIDDHDFEYGFQGGLMRFERQVQDVDIRNILLGRGGTQNVPYRYFKTTDPQNPDWAADPDYVPELANVYFDRIRDANFRRYIQGWRTNQNGALGAIDTYDPTRAATDWAYEKGHTDTAFDPVEYVKDDPSILRYGERWGHLEDNDEIYPTIQGVIVDGFRVDTVMDVSPILSDDIYAAADGAAAIVDIDGVMTQTDTVAAGLSTKEIRGSSFTVPTGRTANLMDNGFFVRALSAQRSQQVRLTVGIDNSFIKVYNQSTGAEVNRDGIPAGTYYYVITVQVANLNQSAVPDVTYGVNGMYLMTSAASSGEWSPTFDIYVCNLFNTTQGVNESDEDYAIRVWKPILGDKLGNEAKVIFSDGPMSISEDYEFPIATYPMPDRSKTFGGVTSEWRITLNKCDAEFDATGLYIPNAETGGKPVAGNHFFFIGIDMPHFYVTEAEKRLTAYKEAALPDHAEANPTWVITLDKIRIDQQYNPQHERLIDKIDAGVGLSIYDVRFSGGQTLNLYASSVTFTWADGTVMLPEVNVVLTEKTSVVKSSYQELRHDVSVIKATYATEDGASSASREQSKQLFLGKNGEAQTSLSPTRFASIVASENFNQGEFGGKGWGFYEDNSDLYQDKDGVDEGLIEKQSVLEVDKLVVRRDMMLNKLVVNQTAYFGGRQVISAAAVECTLVVENQGNYICYFDQKQGSVKNLFHLNDIAMSQTFDGSNNVTRYYRRLVIAVGLDYITLSGSVVSGSDIPRVGDTIVQYGNTVDEDRQYAIVRDVIGGGREYMMADLDAVDATGDEYYYAGIKEIEGPAGTSGLAPAPYFFIGNQDSHIKFNSRKQKTYIKGGLVLSPAGTEFPVPCYRGDYEQNATYYPGDLVVYNGESWLHQGDTAITGVAPGTGSSWHKYAAKGASAYRLDLSNEFSTVNADSSGAIVPGAALPSCRAQLYEGTSVLAGTVYSVATPQASAATGVSINASTGELQFSNSFAFTGDTLEVSVTANNTAKGVAMTAIMTIAKIHPGSDGTPATSYWIVLDTDKVSVDPNVTPRVPRPTTVTPTAMMQVGGNAPQAATGCTIEYFYDNETAQTIASGTALTIALMNGATVRKTLHFNLKKGSTVVDQESVPILYDGEKGEDGADGDYTAYAFAYSPDLTSTDEETPPTDGNGHAVSVWYDAPPEAEEGKYLWMRVINMTYNSTTGNYDAGTPHYARISGENGEAPIVADLTNEMDGIGVGANGVLDLDDPTTPLTTSTTFRMFLGLSQVTLTNLTVSGTPTNVTYSLTRQTPGDNTTPYTGEVVFTIANHTDLSNGRYPISITGTYGSISRTVVYTLMGVRNGEDGASFILIPSCTAVKKTPGTTPVYAPTVVTCGATDSMGRPLSEYYIYYSIDGGTPQHYESCSNGIVSPAVKVEINPATANTSITFLLFLEPRAQVNPTFSDYVDIETINIISDGTNGTSGTSGKSVRGVSEWQSGGWNGSGVYQGEEDSGDPNIDGFFIDIVTYKPAGATEPYYYWCKKTHETGYITPENDTDHIYWDRMENFSLIATKAMYAEYINAKNVSAQTLRSNPGKDDYMEITENKIEVYAAVNSAPVNRVHISGKNEFGTTPGTGSFSQSFAAQSGTSQTANLILQSSSYLNITASNNRATISGFIVDLSVLLGSATVEIDRVVGIRAYLYNANTGATVTLGDIYEGQAHNKASVTVPQTSLSLSAGQWYVCAKLTIASLNTGESLDGSITATSISGAYLTSSAGTKIVGDGFSTVWSDSQHSAQGFEATVNGAKVIRDGLGYDAIGGGALNNLTPITILVACSTVPDSNLIPGALYIKVG